MSVVMDASTLPQVFSIQLETEKKNTKIVCFISLGFFWGFVLFLFSFFNNCLGFLLIFLEDCGVFF